MGLSHYEISSGLETKRFNITGRNLTLASSSFFREYLLSVSRLMLLLNPKNAPNNQTFYKAPAYPTASVWKFVGFSFAFWTLPVIHTSIQSYLAHIVLDLPQRPMFVFAFILSD